MFSKLGKGLFLVGLCALFVNSWVISSWADNSSSHSKILVLGDSISAGFGIPVQEGWVNLMHKELQQSDAASEVINASISGETTRGGLTRLPKLLDEHRPTLTIIELGGNDGLRGMPIMQIERNLSELIRLAQAADSQVLLLGMQIPPNYGARYTELFKNLYPKLAKQHQTGLVPFLLAGVAENPDLMQSDGIHPKAAAQAQMWELVKPELQKML